MMLRLLKYKFFKHFTKFIAACLSVRKRKKRKCSGGLMCNRVEGKEPWSEGFYRSSCQLWMTSGAGRLLELGSGINGYISIVHILRIRMILKSTSSWRTSSISSCHNISPLWYLCRYNYAFLSFTVLCQALLGKRTLLLS